MAESSSLRAEILRLVPDPYPTKKAVAAAAGVTETTLYNIIRTNRASAGSLAKLRRIGVRGLGPLVDTFDAA